MAQGPESTYVRTFHDVRTSLENTGSVARLRNIVQNEANKQRCPPCSKRSVPSFSSNPLPSLLLESFLCRSTVFAQEEMEEIYGERARANLEREIQDLSNLATD